MQYSVCAVVLLITGLVLSIIGCGGYFLWPSILESQVKDELVLTNTSRSYNLWKKTPIPMYLETRMFNWTNPSETLTGKAKANFVEMGPYVFKEQVTKDNLIWNDNGTITYRNRHVWHFVPELSNGSLTDMVTNINVIAMTVGNLLKHLMPETLLPLVDPILQKEESHIAVTKTVQELVFDGYTDQLLNIFQRLKKYIKIKMPFDKFGWFYGRNNSATYDGVFNMDTGAFSLRHLGNLLSWNYKSRTKSFDGPCGDVHGSGGELWPIDSSSQDAIFIFSPELCGSLRLSRKGSKEVAGISASVHVGDENTFDNGQLSPENRCYCAASQCPPQGARNIAKCRFGAPAFISHPHFYLADEIYRAGITGMNPSAELHELSIAMDKVVSIPLEVNARLQINILAEKIIGLQFFNGLPNSYFPMMWFNEKATISGDLASQMKSLTYVANYVEPGLLILAGLGLLFICLGFFIGFSKRKTAPSTPLLSETTET